MLSTALGFPVGALEVALAAVEVVHRLIAYMAQRGCALDEDLLPAMNAREPDELRAGVRRIGGLDRRCVPAIVVPAAYE